MGSNNAEGLQFWRRKLGSSKVDSLLVQHRQNILMLNNQNSTSTDLSITKPKSENFEDVKEIVIELSRDEMQAYYDEA